MTKDKTITAGQAGAMCFFVVLANKILVLPSLLAEKTKAEAIFVPIVLFLFEFLMIFFFFRLKKRFSNLSFSEIVRRSCGKWASVLMSVLFVLFFLSKAVLLYNIKHIFLKNVVYHEEDSLVYFVCFIPVVTHMAISGLRVMGRTMQIFLPIVLIAFAFVVVVGFTGIVKIPVFFESTPSMFFSTTFSLISVFGDSVFLFLIMDKIEIKEGEFKKIFLPTLISAIFVCLINVVFVLSYSYTAFMHPYAFFEMVSFVKEYGGLGRLDIIPMVVIIIISYFQLSMYMKFFMIAFCDVFDKMSDVLAAVIFDFFFLFLVNFVVLTSSRTILYGEVFLPYISIVPFVIVPILSIVGLLSKRRILEADR